jgi:predicted CopG family antitoxin
MKHLPSKQETKKELVKTLKINDDTHECLKTHGRFGDSFDDILNRLMDIVEGKAKAKPKE